MGFRPLPIVAMAALILLVFDEMAIRAADLAGQAGADRGPMTRVERCGGRPHFTLDGQPLTVPVFETYVPDQQ